MRPLLKPHTQMVSWAAPPDPGKAEDEVMRHFPVSSWCFECLSQLLHSAVSLRGTMWLLAFCSSHEANSMKSLLASPRLGKRFLAGTVWSRSQALVFDEVRLPGSLCCRGGKSPSGHALNSTLDTSVGMSTARPRPASVSDCPSETTSHDAFLKREQTVRSLKAARGVSEETQTEAACKNIAKLKDMVFVKARGR